MGCTLVGSGSDSGASPRPRSRTSPVARTTRSGSVRSTPPATPRRRRPRSSRPLPAPIAWHRPHRPASRSASRPRPPSRSPGPPRRTRRASPSTGSTRKGRRSVARRRPRGTSADSSAGARTRSVSTRPMRRRTGLPPRRCRRRLRPAPSRPHRPRRLPDDGLDGPDGAAEPSNDLGHADGGLARLGLEHRPGRHVRLPDLP